jgi:cell pole-organizing protein PopZ
MTQPDTQKPQPRTVRLTVKECSHVVDSRSNDQWKLKVDVPWSQYADTMYLDYAVPDGEPVIGQQYPCAISPRNIKKAQDGTEKDPQQEYNWWWKIDRWNVDGSSPVDAPPAPTGQVKDNAPAQTSYTTTTRNNAGPVQITSWEEQPMKPDHPSKRRSIERQASLKAAIDYLQDKESTSDLLFVASLFYEWISAPPEAAQVPPEAPESPGEPVTKGIADQAAMAIVQGGPAEVSGETLAYDNDGNPEPVTSAVASDTDFNQFWQWVAEVHPVRKEGNTPADEVAEALGRPLDQWLDGKLRTIGAAAERCKLNWDSE